MNDEKKQDLINRRERAMESFETFKRKSLSISRVKSARWGGDWSRGDGAETRSWRM